MERGGGEVPPNRFLNVTPPTFRVAASATNRRKMGILDAPEARRPAVSMAGRQNGRFPMAPLRYLESPEPELNDPILVGAFAGWCDAGGGASGAAKYLIDRWHATRIAEIEAE